MARKKVAVVDRSGRMVAVQGFEIPLGLARRLTDDAVFILGHIARKGAAFFQADDGQQDTVAQLQEIASEGYFVMHSQGYLHTFVVPEKFEVRV